MIFTENPEINPNLTLDDLPGTFGGAVNASMQSALYNSPVWQISRTLEDQSNAGGSMLDYETARGKAKEAGVDVRIDPKGMSEGALSILIDRKRFQARTQDALARGPHGFAAGSAYFLSGLGAAMLDPINLASAFIPVARGLGMAADIAAAGRLGEVGAAATTAGRVAARIRVGAAEGAVGQAILEPLTAYRASQEQEDYGITDTLMNVGFGAVLGAVAHSGLGALGDRMVAAERGRKAGDLIDSAKAAPEVFARDSAAAKLQAADMETNSAVFRSEIAAAADGRKMDNSVLVTERAPQYTTRQEDQQVWQHQGASMTGLQDNPMYFSLEGDNFFGQYTTRTEFTDQPIAGTLKGHLDFKNPLVESQMTREQWDAIIQKARENGADESELAAWTKSWLEREEFGLGKPDELFRAMKELGYDGVIADKSLKSPHAIALNPAETLRVIDDGGLFPKVDPIKVQQAAAASHLPENDVHYDAKAKAEVDAAVAERPADVDPVEAVTRATQEAQTELAMLSKQLGLDPEMNTAMRGADDTAATASRYSKAIEAYASCQVRS